MVNPTPSHRSFWLESCGEDLSYRAELEGDRKVDVAILGGGFTGLWTAYFLHQCDPSLSIAIVEREFVGFGASGRNGGWCSPRFPVDAHALLARFGRDAARATILALEQMVIEIGAICEREGIDAHYRQTGLLSLARSPQQMAKLAASMATFAKLGLDGDKCLLSADAARDKVHATHVHGGMASAAGATIHPGRLVRGLARAVERRGVTIYERTPVTAIRHGADAGLVTPRGRLSARLAVVAAGESYLTEMPHMRRAVLPMSSVIVLTEPLSESLWAQIGWRDGECLSSLVHTKNYLTKTQDGRILYGSRGAPYQYGSAMPESVVNNPDLFAQMHEELHEWWPALASVRFTHGWGGFLGVPRDWLPAVAFDPATRKATCSGFTGRGVSTTALSAKLLAECITGQTSALADLPMHRPAAPLWEVEPLRWLGVRYVQNAFARMDAADRDGRAAPFDSALAERLGEQ